MNFKKNHDPNRWCLPEPCFKFKETNRLKEDGKKYTMQTVQKRVLSGYTNSRQNKL